MYLVTVTSPANDDFVSLGKTKEEAIDNLVKAYKDFYDYDEETLEYEHGYSNFKSYLENYTGMGIYKISSGETVIMGIDIHYKKGERI